MQAINFLTVWVSYLLLIIPVGAATTVTYFAVNKSLSFDLERKGYCDLCIRKTIKGAIIGVTISGFITIIKSFFV